MIKELLKVANILDEKGYTKEADILDDIILAFAGKKKSKKKSNKKSEFTPAQIAAFDPSGNDIPFEPEDWKLMGKEKEEAAACDKKH